MASPIPEGSLFYLAQVRICEGNEMSDMQMPSTEAGQRSMKQPARKGWVRRIGLFPWLLPLLTVAVLVAVGMWVGLSAPVQAQGTEDYDADDDGLIEVSSLAQLNAIRWDLDGDGVSDTPGYAGAFPSAMDSMGCPDDGCNGFELTDNLDFDTDGDGSVDSDDDYRNAGAGWQPLGTPRTSFDTRFMGNGHTISNLYIRRPTETDVALFGVTRRAGHISGTGLELVDVQGHSGVGGLVGQHLGTVTTVFVGGNVVGSWHRVGGLVGDSRSGIVTSSYSTANVTGDGGVGGLTGYEYRGGNVYASYAVGRVNAQQAAGGLIGYTSRGKVMTSYSTGRVTGPADNVGGVIGVNGSTTRANYWDAEASGNPAGNGGAGKTIKELQSPVGYEGIYADWDLYVDGDGSADDPWDFGTSLQYPVLKVDFNGDGEATWEEFGNQRGASVVVEDYHPLVGSRQEIQAVLRDGLPSSGATYQWQRTSSAGWWDVGPTSDTRDVEFDTAGTRTYRAVVTLGSGVVIASDPVSITWRARAVLTANNLSPARGEPVTLTAQLAGDDCSSLSYAWFGIAGDGTATGVGPENLDTKTGMFYQAESRTHRVEISCTDSSGEVTKYTSPNVIVTATNEIWPYASVASDDDDNVVESGDVVELRANLERREPPLNWLVTWERRFGNGEWRDVGSGSGRKRLQFNSPGARTYRSSIYIIQLDETVKSDPITVTWTD